MNKEKLDELIKDERKNLERLAVIYWEEKYGGKFLATVSLKDLPDFFEWVTRRSQAENEFYKLAELAKEKTK